MQTTEKGKMYILGETCLTKESFEVEFETKKEFYPNGQLRYEETIVEVPANVNPFYFPNSRIRDNGSKYIRVGWCKKYHKNGQLFWGLKYNNAGDVIEASTKYRKDGTIIKM